MRVEALLAQPSVEGFDLERDPVEVENPALNKAKYGDLLVQMHDKLNRLVEAEVGEDVGQMLPGRVDGGWVATDAVKEV